MILDAFDERNEAALHFFGGLVCEQLNEPERAETEFQSAVKAGARPQDVQFGRSHPPVEIPLHLHHRLKEHNNGLAWFLHEKFLGQLDRGQLIEGIETLREALDIEEQSFEINHNLALLHYDLADLDHAEMYCARALWVREGDAACHELMGNINFRQYAYGRAAYEFRRMIAFDPENPFAYYNLGSACSVLHDPAQAEILWRKAIDFDRDSLAPEPEKRTTDGKRGYTVVAKRTPVAYLAHKSLGNLYAEQSLVDKAIAEFEAAVRLRPDDASPYLSLGQLYQRKNDKDKAVFCLEKYLFLGGPKDVEARRLLDALKK